jgi:hypothetical protein
MEKEISENKKRLIVSYLMIIVKKDMKFIL